MLPVKKIFVGAAVLMVLAIMFAYTQVLIPGVLGSSKPCGPMCGRFPYVLAPGSCSSSC